MPPEQGRPKAKPKAKATATRSCAVCGVSSNMPPKARFCYPRKRCYDSMAEQAKKAGTMDTFNEVMGNPDSMVVAILDFADKNPPGARFKRKSLIDWVQWKRTFTRQEVYRHRVDLHPFEEEEWVRWKVNAFGWVRTEAKQEWDRMASLPNSEIDHLGHRGAVRMWLPRDEARHVDRARVVQESMVQGSAQMKKMSESEFGELRTWVGSRQLETDAWTREKASAGATASGATDAPNDEKEEDDDGLQEKDDNSMVTDRAKNKLFDTMVSECTALSKRAGEVVDSANKAIVNIPADGDLSLAERAYKGSLHSRLLFVLWWMGKTVAENTRAATAEYASCGDGSATCTLTDPTEDDEKIADMETLLVQFKGKLPIQQPQHLVGQAAMSEQLGKILEVQLQKDFEAQRVAWKVAANTAKQLIESLATAKKDWDGHTQSKAATLKREQAKVRRAAEKMAVKNAAEKARAAAQKLSEASTKQKNLQPIFKVPTTQFTCARSFPNDGALLRARTEENHALYDAPFVLCGSESILKLHALKIIQTTSSNFANLYPDSEGCKSSGAAQCPMLPKEGKTEADHVFGSFAPLASDMLDISSVAGGSRFHAQSWWWGYQNAHGFVDVRPVCAAMLQICLVGHVTVLTASVSGVSKYMRGKGKGTTFSDLTELFANASERTIHDMLDNNVSIYAATVKTGEMLWIPVGFVIAERTLNEPTHFGIRKSYMMKSATAYADFHAAAELLRSTSGRNPEKMDEVEKLMAASLPKGPPTPAAAQATGVQGAKAAMPAASAKEATEAEAIEARAATAGAAPEAKAQSALGAEGSMPDPPKVGAEAGARG